MQHQTELHNYGREAVGEITRIRSAGKGNNWAIGYSFTVDGTAFSGEAQVPKQLVDNIGKGIDLHGSLSIRYLPSNPPVNYPAGWQESTRSLLMPLILSTIPTIIGIGLLLPFSPERQLISEGLPTVGTITKYNRAKGRSYASMCYEFRLDDGRIMSGCSPCDDASEVGASVCILYLPQNPQRNGRYPLQYYRVTCESDPSTSNISSK